MSYEFDSAKEHYAGLKHVEAPTDVYVGPLPILVAYRNGVPARTWKGEREVSTALTQITRGEFDPQISVGDLDRREMARSNPLAVSR